MFEQEPRTYSDFLAFNCVIEFFAQALSCFDGRLGRFSCRLCFRVAENAPENRVSDSKGTRGRSPSPKLSADRRSPRRGRYGRCAQAGAQRRGEFSRGTADLATPTPDCNGFGRKQKRRVLLTSGMVCRGRPRKTSERARALARAFGVALQPALRIAGAILWRISARSGAFASHRLRRRGNALGSP